MVVVEPPEILAAGAVVSRKGPQVLVIHRPKYDDWSFPKGKLDPGEHATTAAVREVNEETGLDIRLGPALPHQDYLTGNGTMRSKRVFYWAGRVVGDDDVSGYAPNTEVDDVRWLDVDEARATLSHDYDRDVLDAFVRVRKRTTPLVVVRHARAEPRKAWAGDDLERPLTETGLLQSDRLVPLLAAYGVGRITSSAAKRCWTTVAPYAHVAGPDLHVTDDLAEGADERTVADVVHDLLTDRTPAVLCTHRQTLPAVWAALGVPEHPLDPAGLVVLHHRRGRVVATEEHSV